MSPKNFRIHVALAGEDKDLLGPDFVREQFATALSEGQVDGIKHGTLPEKSVKDASGTFCMLVDADSIQIHDDTGAKIVSMDWDPYGNEEKKEVLRKLFDQWLTPTGQVS